MVEPRRAPVRPRVLSPWTGDSLLLEDEIRALLAARAWRLIQVVGPAGSGKTTALQHLAAVLRPGGGIVFLDDASKGCIHRLTEPKDRLVIAAQLHDGADSSAGIYRLAPWGEDECLEYLLAVHPQRCASVMARLRAARRNHGVGIPEVWRIVLDEMAADESLAAVQDALRRFLARELAYEPVAEQVRAQCLSAVSVPRLVFVPDAGKLRKAGCSELLLRALRHAPVQYAGAVEGILAGLLSEKPSEPLTRPLPRPLIRAIAETAARAPRIRERLNSLVRAGETDCHPMAASILHATDTGWVPEGDPLPKLTGAYLPDVAWPYVNLAGAELGGADLSRAYLRGAVLDRAWARKANLREACLQAASLQAWVASDADLTGADLSSAKAEGANFQSAAVARARFDSATLQRARFDRADLTGVSFLEADLTGAALRGATITGADFTGANLQSASLDGLPLREATLTGARFVAANLSECDLEYVQLPGADFSGANLHSALLTGSWIPEGRFENACLARAGLADVHWEGADLRNADLSNASFHAGTTRSGMIFSPIPCEGSKTGFYTDDDAEQFFKAPEAIRKANLRGADLRGAKVRGADFYLVDLRDALYDPEQEQHFRRCRALLEARV